MKDSSSAAVRRGGKCNRKGPLRIDLTGCCATAFISRRLYGKIMYLRKSFSRVSRSLVLQAVLFSSPRIVSRRVIILLIIIDSTRDDGRSRTYSIGAMAQA
eukprot:scaffold4157_cov58-Attheya_sp.AAC.4